jgi:hypothetical protein
VDLVRSLSPRYPANLVLNVRIKAFFGGKMPKMPLVVFSRYLFYQRINSILFPLQKGETETLERTVDYILPGSSVVIGTERVS